eukprot:CAMPEP_0171378764 /NCGR_PEP_ID=MMETSP0879-20121228/24790_1 /TAXON_ID=67004 /ORGANISM="Thalassiosira weissflogii, Strain CCMP1336" /LENGTH=86 /DNA_ID=CAMNT_0011889297 /DNA_START=163 /DNA_END=421 /DNA_ORIENTATION=-
MKMLMKNGTSQVCSSPDTMDSVRFDFESKPFSSELGSLQVELVAVILPWEFLLHDYLSLVPSSGERGEDCGDDWMDSFAPRSLGSW